MRRERSLVRLAIAVFDSYRIRSDPRRFGRHTLLLSLQLFRLAAASCAPRHHTCVHSRESRAPLARVSTQGLGYSGACGAPQIHIIMDTLWLDVTLTVDSTCMIRQMISVQSSSKIDAWTGGRVGGASMRGDVVMGRPATRHGLRVGLTIGWS